MRYANPIDVEQWLLHARFPSVKSFLVNYAKDSHAPEEIITALERIPEREYKDAADAARETYITPEWNGEGQYGVDSCDD